jgi:hypothetical protein
MTDLLCEYVGLLSFSQSAFDTHVILDVGSHLQVMSCRYTHRFLFEISVKNWERTCGAPLNYTLSYTVECHCGH